MSQANKQVVGMIQATARLAPPVETPPGKPPIDLIFDLIEQHATDQAAFEALLAADSDGCHSEVYDRTWCETVQVSLHELIETPPTTLAGAFALIAHIQNSNVHEVMNQDEWLELLTSLESCFRNLSVINQ
jgi:hypothetical protein